jgi:carbohydrate-selective porin OprB
VPDYQNRFSQITYTQTLPGEMLSVAIGRYSFSNFDSSEFMADQQLNFVNNIFSANGSATYPTTGLGAYVQFNATKTLQFLAGQQSVNENDPSKRPVNGFGSGPYARLGYVQWTPSLKNPGDAQYSLTLYQAPATSKQAQSKGWSINAAVSPAFAPGRDSAWILSLRTTLAF